MRGTVDLQVSGFAVYVQVTARAASTAKHIRSLIPLKSHISPSVSPEFEIRYGVGPVLLL